jgi:hypothetical protein
MGLLGDPRDLITVFLGFFSIVVLVGVVYLVWFLVGRRGRSSAAVLEAENRRLREQLGEERRLREQLEENRRLREQLGEKRGHAEPGAAPDPSAPR